MLEVADVPDTCRQRSFIRICERKESISKVEYFIVSPLRPMLTLRLPELQ